MKEGKKLHYHVKGNITSDTWVIKKDKKPCYLTLSQYMITCKLKWKVQETDYIRILWVIQLGRSRWRTLMHITFILKLNRRWRAHSLYLSKYLKFLISYVRRSINMRLLCTGEWQWLENRLGGLTHNLKVLPMWILEQNLQGILKNYLV